MTEVQTARLLSGVWLPRREPRRVVMPCLLTVEGPTETLVLDLAMHLSAVLEWARLGATCVPADSWDFGLLSLSAAERTAGALVVSPAEEQPAPEFSAGSSEPSISDVRIQLTQPVSGDFADYATLLRRRTDVRRVISQAKGMIGL